MTRIPCDLEFVEVISLISKLYIYFLLFECTTLFIQFFNFTLKCNKLCQNLYYFSKTTFRERITLWYTMERKIYSHTCIVYLFFYVLLNKVFIVPFSLQI